MTDPPSSVCDEGREAASGTDQLLTVQGTIRKLD